MKSSLKLLFLAATTSIVGVSCVVPFLTSCKIKQANLVEYNQDKKTLDINSSKLVFDNLDFFQAYNQILVSQDNSNIKSKLTSIYKEWLTSLGVDTFNLILDFDKLTIEGFSFVIPTTVSDVQYITKEDNTTPSITSTKINFSNISAKSINKQLASNSIHISTSSTEFLGYSLEDIQKLPYDQILEKTAMTGSIIFEASGNFPFSTFTIKEESDFRTLRILIFTPNKGLGQIVITEYGLIVEQVKATTLIKSTFGDAVTSDWKDIAANYMPNLDQQTFTTITPSDTINSYNNAIKIDSVTQKITEYTNDLSTNFNQDLSFYLKYYLSKLQSSWGLSSLLTTGVFTTNNLTFDTTNKTINGSVGIVINNPSSGTKKISLPISNEEILVNAYSAITLILDFNNANLFPYLTSKNSNDNTAYLTTALSNATLKYQITSLEQDLKDATNIVVQNFTTTTNVFPYSYALKVIVNNVGFGNSIADSDALLNKSLAQLTVNDLKNLHKNDINHDYKQTLLGVKTAQNIILKIAENPTVYNLLKSLSSEFGSIVYLITNDSDISSIITDLFSSKTTSEFLYANLNTIIKILKKQATQYPEILIVTNMLETIANTNQTATQFANWVKSIESLYPTLDKLLGANTKWIMPLLKTVMTYISKNDPQILDLVFDNLDFILNFLTQSDTQEHLNVKTQKIISAILNYLSVLTNSDTSSTRFKNIKVLDLLTNELTNSNREKTLINLVVTILEILQPNHSLITTLKQVNSLIGSKIVVPTTLNDYSNATWNNEVTKDTIKKYKVQADSSTSVSLTSQISKILKSLVYVNVNNTKQDIYTVLSTNVNIIENKDQFSYDSTKHEVTEDVSIKMNFKNLVTFDLMPLVVFMDNLKLDLSSLIPGGTYSQTLTTTQKDGSLQEVKPNNINIKDINLGGIKLTIDIPLGSMLPTDIVICPENYIEFNYKTQNAKLMPSIQPDNGAINWSYNSTKNITLFYDDNTKGILAASNQQYNNQIDLSTKKYYGSNYKVKKTNLLSTILDTIKLPNIDLSKIKLEGYVGVKLTTKVLILNTSTWLPILPNLFTLNSQLSSTIITTTKLNSPLIIENYNSNIFVLGSTITQNKSNSDITTYLTSLINNYGQWTKDTSSNKERFNLKSGNDLTTKFQEYFTFGNAFDQNLIYSLGITASHYSLILKDYYDYTFTLKFSHPVAYQTYGNATSKIVSNLSFIVKSNSAPTPTTQTNKV